jgi:hypothetical protein
MTPRSVLAAPVGAASSSAPDGAAAAIADFVGRR